MLVWLNGWPVVLLQVICHCSRFGFLFIQNWTFPYIFPQLVDKALGELTQSLRVSCMSRYFETSSYAENSNSKCFACLCFPMWPVSWSFSANTLEMIIYLMSFGSVLTECTTEDIHVSSELSISFIVISRLSFLLSIKVYQRLNWTIERNKEKKGTRTISKSTETIQNTSSWLRAQIMNSILVWALICGELVQLVPGPAGMSADFSQVTRQTRW